jgi:hypothetical protein
VVIKKEIQKKEIQKKKRVDSDPESKVSEEVKRNMLEHINIFKKD